MWLLIPFLFFPILSWQGTEAIRSITFNFSETAVQDMQLSPHVFSMMSKLRFLDFYGGNQYLLHFPQGLQSLPNGLRYLRWMHYPLKSLPKKFSAENLVILDLPYSKVESLWRGVQVNSCLYMFYSYYYYY